MKRLNGKTALVTAAGQGIGRASAERMAREGALVIATDVNDAALAELARLDGITARKLDVLDGAAIAALPAAIGPVDILFNCAGVVHSGTVLEATEAEWDFAFELNVKAQFRMIRAVLPGMLAKGAGSIINMSSLAGAIGLEDCAAYCAAKAAVNQLSRLAALEGGRHDPPIRVNALAPGVIMSEMITRAYGNTPEVRDFVMAGNALATPGEVADVAAGVLYLASARFVTGTVLTIDGGRGVD